METEIGKPIEYNPVDILDEKDMDMEQDREPEQSTDPYYYPPQPQYILPPPVPDMQKSPDVFASLDKVAYIVIFVAFILGFFMGKTLQPVILRTG
jgi:hypothetical protein